jgi:hypothetical protein
MVTLKRLMLANGMPITLAKAAAMFACSNAVTSLTAEEKVIATTTDALGAVVGRGVGGADGVLVTLGRGVQATELGGDVKPAAQALQKVALELDANVFAEHGMQATAPAAEYMPAGQSVQTVPYFPAPQLEQALAPAVDSLPMTQSKQAVDESVGEYFPGPHCTQVGERSDSEKWPKAQEVQVVEADTME